MTPNIFSRLCFPLYSKFYFQNIFSNYHNVNPLIIEPLTITSSISVISHKILIFFISLIKSLIEFEAKRKDESLVY